MKKRLRVVELFAGVGGFRIALEGYPKKKNTNYEVVWSNQWEPSTRLQHANIVYTSRWPKANHSGENIETVIQEKFDTIPDHDVLVGGFPCQDYSVATSLRSAKGLVGKKGVLWWSIEAILRLKKNKPKYLILENVDRLLKSPATQRGRDFAIMLISLYKQGYAVEWRVINAADYGFPQRRRRIFILAYHKTTALYQRLAALSSKEEMFTSQGVFAKAFPIQELNEGLHEASLEEDLVQLSKNFNLNQKESPFHNSGFMIAGRYTTTTVAPKYQGARKTLGSVLLDISEVPEAYFITKEQVEGVKGWKYQKGAKNETRINKEGYKYTYSEGSMRFPDALDAPSRTIVTGEGGTSPSRFKHVVLQQGKLRRLTPIELERLNTFPDNHTQHPSIRPAKRAFFMGNALVVAVVKRLADTLFTEVV